MKKLFILFALFSSCTNAEYKQFTSFGSTANVKCYSGGVLILDIKSTGKVLTEKQSDGWYFEDSKTKNLIRVSADCIIEN